MSNEQSGRGVAYGLGVTAAVACLSWGLSGCMATYLRARMSTLQHINEASSVVVVSASPEDVMRRVSSALAQHGAAPTEMGRSLAGGALFIYRAPRPTPAVATSTGYVGVGSAYFVRLRDTSNGVEVMLVGKPTLNGVDLCSDSDRLFVEFSYRCLDSSLTDDSAVWPHVTGREEVEVVRGVLASLAQPPAPPATPTTTTPTQGGSSVVTF